MRTQEHPKPDAAQVALYLLDIKEVAKRTSLSRTTIWRRIKSDKFPTPLRLSDQCVRWRSDEIDRWIADLQPAVG